MYQHKRSKGGTKHRIQKKSGTREDDGRDVNDRVGISAEEAVKIVGQRQLRDDQELYRRERGEQEGEQGGPPRGKPRGDKAAQRKRARERDSRRERRRCSRTTST